MLATPYRGTAKERQQLTLWREYIGVLPSRIHQYQTRAFLVLFFPPKGGLRALQLCAVRFASGDIALPCSRTREHQSSLIGFFLSHVSFAG